MTCLVADLNHANPIDVQRLRAADWNGIKCEAIIHKASQGASYRDPKYMDRRFRGSSCRLSVGCLSLQLRRGRPRTGPAFSFGCCAGIDRRCSSILRTTPRANELGASARISRPR